MDANDVIQAAANLVDNPDDAPGLTDEYRRGVIGLAASLCFTSAGSDEFIVMGYAVYGVNRHRV